MPDKGAWVGSRRKCHAFLCCQTFTGSCAFPHMAPSFFIHKGLSDFPCQSAVSRPAHTAGRQLGPHKKSFPAVSGKGLFMIYDTLEIGRRIQKLRREKGLTQEQLAERLNVSTVHLAKIETGKCWCPLPPRSRSSGSSGMCSICRDMTTDKGFYFTIKRMPEAVFQKKGQ